MIVFEFSSAVTGGLFRVSAGLKPAIGGTVLGVLLRYVGALSSTLFIHVIVSSIFSSNNMGIQYRDSFRKICKGGGGKHVRRHFGGGGGARVQWAVFNFKGLQFPRGGHKVFKGGANAPPPPPPPPNETLQYSTCSYVEGGG